MKFHLYQMNLVHSESRTPVETMTANNILDATVYFLRFLIVTFNAEVTVCKKNDCETQEDFVWDDLAFKVPKVGTFIIGKES